MNKAYYLGIDLGTSSIKAILKSPDGHILKGKKSYHSQSPDCWKAAMKAVIAELTENFTGTIAAAALSAQVGTYLVNEKDVLSWQSDAGRQELSYIKSKFLQKRFIQEISMPHPDLISYPLPRLLYIQKHYGAGCSVMMPKDFLIRELTGNSVTDIYSMRGIANLQTCQYAAGILSELDIPIHLPELKRPEDLAGYITQAAAEQYGLPVGMPVYTGCNDFYAGLLGMGICRTGDAFDLTGTSEHIGYISENLQSSGFVSGGYFAGFCTYGGTKASGSSCQLAIDNFGIDGLSTGDILPQKPPVFLPYLSGERAPIFDENARGVYFGLHAETDKNMLSYATLEGVVFSLYHIAQSMQMPSPKRLICGGGGARSDFLNSLKATIFGCPVVATQESDTSALGACILAMAACGCYEDLEAAVKASVTYQPEISPDMTLREQLLCRYSIYKELYPALKSTFALFGSMQ